jgi:hypothetical protein
VRPKVTYDPKTRTVVRWSVPAGPARLHPAVALSFRQLLWNRGRQRTDWIVLYGDGRLYVRRSDTFDFATPGRPSCRLAAAALAATHRVVKAQRFFALAPRYSLGRPRPGCSVRCGEPGCTPRSCFERLKTSTGRSIELRIRAQGRTHGVRWHNAGETDALGRMAAILDTLKGCARTRVRSHGALEPLWSLPFD